MIDNPCALRSAILMAGMHFSFQFGDLATFESTFLYHKIEVMRVINRWIASGDYKLEAAIIREMATLAFTEVSYPTIHSSSESFYLLSLRHVMESSLLPRLTSVAFWR